MDQNGNNNSIFSNLSNNTTQLYSAVLQQNGDGNNIELNLLGNNVIPGIDRLVSVTQTGNDLNFTGTYDSPDQPVKIEQTSGNRQSRHECKHFNFCILFSNEITFYCKDNHFSQFSVHHYIPVEGYIKKGSILSLSVYYLSAFSYFYL